MLLESGVPALLLPLGPAARPEVRDELRPPRLQRAIDVIYRPETELQTNVIERRHEEFRETGGDAGLTADRRRRILERRSVTNIARLTIAAMVLLTGCATIRGFRRATPRNC